jgi:GNAT superfamily N-acetyltransferase
VPEVAHLGNLFVRRSEFGSGLASALLAEVVKEAAARGFTAMRLFTPSEHARARRFYEREGWAGSEPFDDPAFGMPVIEYRRRL